MTESLLVSFQPSKTFQSIAISTLSLGDKAGVHFFIYFTQNQPSWASLIFSAKLTSPPHYPHSDCNRLTCSGEVGRGWSWRGKRTSRNQWGTPICTTLSQSTVPFTRTPSITIPRSYSTTLYVSEGYVMSVLSGTAWFTSPSAHLYFLIVYIHGTHTLVILPFLHRSPFRPYPCPPRIASSCCIVVVVGKSRSQWNFISPFVYSHLINHTWAHIHVRTNSRSHSQWRRRTQNCRSEKSGV